jgi:hypothetical protein
VPARKTVQVDPQLVSNRALRKQRLGPFPTRGTDERPWSDFDHSIARSVPSFDDYMWTLGDTARWVIERTPDAVNGLSIDKEKLLEVLPEIQKAFSGGEVPGFANTQNDSVPRELPAETWSVYDLAVEERNGLIRIFPASSSANYEQQLFNVRVKRADALERWPDRSDKPTTVRATTVGAENQCRQWLIALMKKDPGRPRPKSHARAEGLDKFTNLSARGFDRAWDAAVRQANAPKWAAPGRRRDGIESPQ